MTTRDTTSFHLCRCIINASESHNQRLKEVPNSREDLRGNNIQWINRPLMECYHEDKKIWEEVHKKRMARDRAPIKEGVLVTNAGTTPEDIDTFCEKCRNMLGIVAIQYYMHNDEGHYDRVTNEWIPNYHVHIVFDCLCKEHTLEYVYNEKTKRLEQKDMYGCIRQLGRSGYRKLQDIAAEAVHMKRGIPGRGPHLSGLQYTYLKTKENLELTREELKQINETLDVSFIYLNCVLTKQRASLIENFESVLNGLSRQDYPKEWDTLDSLKDMGELTRQNFTEEFHDAYMQTLDKAHKTWMSFSSEMEREYSSRIQSMKEETQALQKEMDSYKYLPEKIGLSPRVRKLEYTINELTLKILCQNEEIESLKNENFDLKDENTRIRYNAERTTGKDNQLIQRYEFKNEELKRNLSLLATLIVEDCPDDVLQKLKSHGLEKLLISNTSALKENSYRQIKQIPS